MGAVQDRVLECFESGAGTCYSDYPCFHQIMAEDSEQTVTSQLFRVLLPLAPGLVARIEAGIDVWTPAAAAARPCWRWRSATWRAVS